MNRSAHHDIATEATLLGPTDEATLQLRFQGPFEGRTVTWDATLVALNTGDGHPFQRNFIDVGEEGDAGVRLTVGLNVPCIDLPTVRKAIMMIRQYKRLGRGFHEYGPERPV